MSTFSKDTTVQDLNVIETYKKLMEASTGDQSAYLRAKETVTELVNTDSTLTGRERADIIASTISSIATSITTQAMSAAITISKENRDAPYLLAKIAADADNANAKLVNLEKEGTLLDKRASESTANANHTDAQTAQTKANTLRVIADIRADTGFHTTYDAVELFAADTSGALTVKGDRAVKQKQMLADTYISYASSYRTNGLLTGIQLSSETEIDDDNKYWLAGQVTSCSDAITEVIEDGANNNNKLAHGLTYHQTRVANRNEKAFDDNMRQHAINSSSSMLGVMLGSSVFTDANQYKPYIAKWMTAATYLNGQDCPVECNDCND